MSRFYLDLLINTLLLVVLAVIWTLIIVIPGLFLTNSIIYIVIMSVIGVVIIGAIMSVKLLMSIRKLDLPLIANRVLFVVLVLLGSLITYTITDSRVHGFILAVIGGVFIALINFYKEPINEYLRTVINNAKKK